MTDISDDTRAVLLMLVAGLQLVMVAIQLLGQMLDRRGHRQINARMDLHSDALARLVVTNGKELKQELEARGLPEQRR